MFLEYFQGDPIMAPDQSCGGKNVNNVLDRKNVNTVNKQYRHKHPLVDKIVRGTLTTKNLNNRELRELVKAYNIDLSPGQRVLGNSSVLLTIKSDQQGILIGTLSKR